MVAVNLVVAAVFLLVGMDGWRRGGDAEAGWPLTKIGSLLCIVGALVILSRNHSLIQMSRDRYPPAVTRLR